MTAQDLASARRAEWRTHWPLVLAATVGFGFYSVIVNALGVFLAPMSGEFGWSRTQVMAGLTLMSLTGIFLSPFVGALIDRFGVRRVALPGIVLTALATASFALADGSTLQWTALWAVAAFVVLLIKTTVWTTAISATFDAGRSLAMAITVSGTALSQALVPPLAHWLIAEFGWRAAWVGLGFGWGAVAFALALPFLYDARDARRLGRPGAGAAGVGLAGLTLGQAVRDGALVRIALATFLVMFTGVGIVVNQVPILVEEGLSRQRAAAYASLFGIAGIAGKLVTGYLMDRFEAARVGAWTLAASGVAFLLLEHGSAPAWILLGLVVIGYTNGTKLQLAAVLTGRYGGVAHYGKIFGVISSLIAIAGGFGPLAAALTFDLTGSYAAFVYLAAGLTLFAAWLLLGLGAPPAAFAPAIDSRSPRA
ncbi:MAG: MFS transporter [Porticoccaceae bacterium]|nr:MAG: MFS transporter [Porticoccaceae bacterium]